MSCFINKPVLSSFQSIVFTNASSDFTRWDWKGVTMVIATPTNDSANFKELMCYSHHENTQFGFQGMLFICIYLLMQSTHFYEQKMFYGEKTHWLIERN